MTSLLPDLSRATLNDIIFEGRNKAYGAYDLRLVYPRHLKRAVAAMLGLCAALCVGPQVLAYLEPPVVVTTSAEKPIDEPLHRIQDAPPLPVVTPPAKPLPPVATVQHAPPVVVADKAPVKEARLITMVEANAAPNVGATNQAGPAVAAPPLEVPVAAPAAGEDPDAIFINVQVMPEFPGGYPALLRYLGRNIKYPPLATRNVIEGRVYVKFVVDETGQVVNPEVIKGIGGGCDEEAVRVLRTLPRFTPGQQNGRPVKVYFNVPISFQIK